MFYEPDCSNLSKLSIGRSQGPLNHVLGTKLGFHNAFNVVVGPDFAFVYERVFDLGKAHNGFLVNVVMEGD